VALRREGAPAWNDHAVRRLLPEPQADLLDDALPDAFAFPDVRPWVRGSMVSTLDGAATGRDGSSRSIASPADRRVFSHLRLVADVVLVGAGTLRDERYPPSRRTVAVVTQRLHLPPDLPLFAQHDDEHPRPLVMTTESAAAAAPGWLTDVADVVGCGDGSVDLRRVVDALAERGLGRIHCEGGPKLLGSLARDGLLDELLLTVTPLLAGATSDEHILAVMGGFETPFRLDLTQVLEEDGTVFLRARTRR
jgi:5-amino-6-(5-phosphoribosylamino)uracil reductase